MIAPNAAEAFNLYPAEQTAEPHLTLVVDNGALVESPATAEDELAGRRSDQFKGHVAVEALQAEYDVVTNFAELVDGQMRTTLELSFDGHDLYGPDGRSLTETGKKGLEAAREEAKKNPNMWFEVGRRSLELEEIGAVIDMIKGDEANTMVITSDFPAELRGAKEDVGGYNVTRQQALERAITIDRETNLILLSSQTLDGSNDQALDAVHADLGFEAEPGQKLGQRRLLNLSAEEQATVLDRSTAVYDRQMSAQFGGVWYAGRRPADYRNTYDFVRQQRDLVDACKSLVLSGDLTDDIMYDMAATMEARFRKDQDSPVETQPHRHMNILSTTVSRPSYNPALYLEMMREGRRARRAGRSFSACGSTYKAEGLDESTEEQLKSAGYGNRAGGEGSWHGGKIHKNSKCVSCNKVKDEVGACHICHDCVKHPKGSPRTTQGRSGDPKKAKINKEPAPVISLDAARKAREEKRIETSRKTL